MGIFDKLKKRRAVSDILQDSLNEEKEDMIRGVVDLSDTAVKEVMIPRIDVDFIPMDMETEELLKRVAESGHSRFPVYADSIDNVVGILYVKDLINSFARKEPINLEKIIRKPFFVPESKRIDSLLREFKRRHVHIAVAIDEYGGISGIVCMEDIIEEIVGDIQDEFDNEGEDIASIGDGLWLCDARVDMDDLAECLHTELPSDEFETLGGFVFDLFGKIPVRYEKVRWKNFDFIIQDMDGHKINTVKIAAVKDDDQ
nr:hemolysin family protein [uncultured Treponema sp.]